MGIFNKIKHSYNSVKESITNYFSFMKDLKAFDKSIDRLTDYTNQLDKEIGDIPNDLKIFYEILCTKYSDKYKYEISSYEELLKKINKHDKDIKMINEAINDFSFESVISNPNSFMLNSFDKYENALSTINSYNNANEKYNNFYKEVNEIKDNLEYIKEQYRLKPIFENIMNFDIDHYLDNDYKQEMLIKIQPILDSISKAKKDYYSFSNINNIQKIIDDHNKKYIESHINEKIFNDINGHSLDKEQRISILNNEKSALIIAGAGSGKTLTICGKVKFLLEHENVKSNEILLLSYSKKSASDLNEKVSRINDNLTVATFHKLGLEILKEVNKKSLTVEEQFNAIIEQYFREEINNRPEISEKVLNFFALYLSSNTKVKRFNSEGELYEDLKQNDYRTLKSMLLELTTNDIDKKETIKKEIVKSFEEMAIANFYFINGIDYIYEAPYKIDLSTPDKRQYLPDFYLTQYNIYHEHYGIDKNGNAKQYDDKIEKQYIETMNWKRNVHLQNKTTCLETYSYEFENNTLFPKLESILKAKGVIFKKMTPDKIIKSLKSIYNGQNFKSFINLMRSFLSLYKAKYENAFEFDSLKNSKFKNRYEKERTILFLDIAKDVYLYYVSYLRNENKIDFDDMILQSTKALDNTNLYKYKYIIVDEFQDISYSRMKFLKKLISKGNSHLYAVGDDWQAIYRFSGCDLDIFLNFPKYFGYTSINYITTTYRNSQELQDIAGPFIKANPEQYNKELKSNKHLKSPIKISYYRVSKYGALLKIFEHINSINTKANILILGRNNHDINDYLNDLNFYINKNQTNSHYKKLVCSKYINFNISFSTVHASKGLEEDFVIIINADDSRLGFPNKVEDDKILNLVLSSASKYEYSEERRLWYVALTRSKSYTYIIANKDAPSMFLKEIANSCEIIRNSNNEITDINYCPYCKSGLLTLKVRKSDGHKFYGCSNHPYCKYTINDITAVSRGKRCPECGDFMIYKKGPYGPFYGCHNPRCSHVEKYAYNRQKTASK